MTVALDVGPLRPNPAGVGVYVRALALGLAEIGRDDIVYVGRRPDAEGLPGHVRSFERSARTPYPAWVELFAARSVRTSGANVAHFTDGLVPMRRPTPTVVTVLDLSLVRHWRSHRMVRYPRMPLVLLAPRMADRVIAISRATADEIIQMTRTPARRIDVIPLAARPSAHPVGSAGVAEALSARGLARGGFLLVPGTLEPRKNHVRVIHAFEGLARRSEIPLDMALVLAGQRGWKADQTMAAVAASPVRERIKLTGYVPESELAALMTGAAAVVYASTYEGFGLPVVEAMACGAIVVTSNVSALPEVAGDAGILVDPYDESSISGGIREALSADDAARRRSIERAAQFTWAATAHATAAVYDTLS